MQERRHGVRAYLNRVVERTLIEEILNEVRFTASSKNTQPWKITVLSGDSLEKLRGVCLKQARLKKWNPAFNSTPPKELPSELYGRAKECGINIFKHKGIGRDDLKAREEHNLENFRFFGAPTLFTFCTHAQPNQETWVDLGQFLANLMSALHMAGVGSCPLWSLQALAGTMAEELELKEDEVFCFALAAGYEDLEASVNSYRTNRLELNEFVSWRN